MDVDEAFLAGERRGVYTSYQPTLSDWAPYVAPTSSLPAAAIFTHHQFQKALNWEENQAWRQWSYQKLQQSQPTRFGLVTPNLPSQSLPVVGVDRLNTPALTACSTASTPQSVYAFPIGDSPAYSLQPPSLHLHDYDLAAEATPSVQSLSTSPTDSYLGGYSPTGSDNSWHLVGYQSFQPQETCSISVHNPSETLHHHPITTHFDMSCQEDHAIFPAVDYPQYSCQLDAMSSTIPIDFVDQSSYGPIYTGPRNSYAPIPPVDSSDSNSSSSSSGSSVSVSPPSTPIVSLRSRKRKPNIIKHDKIIKEEKATTRKFCGPLQAKKDGEDRKIGRRRGPLRPDQRKQASAVRKAGACLRCKYLKKTCDIGTPCDGCQAHHARLWNVPCTRMNIRDLGFFMYEWKDDYCRQSIFTEDNIIGTSGTPRSIYIGHGFGIALPVTVCEVQVRNEASLEIQWEETHLAQPISFTKQTANFSLVQDAEVNVNMLHDYLDRQVEGQWLNFVVNHFESTPFLTPMLLTAHKFWRETRSPVIFKALKMLLAYNLTLHITFVEGSDLGDFQGKIDDTASKYCGQVVAPVLVNFQVKEALSKIWRELHKEILEELSSLISGFYHRKQKLKNWAMIFMVSYLLLTLWEQIQFDAIHRCKDMNDAQKFCEAQNGIPVGVVVGMFATMSQKMPAFRDWDPSEHQHLLASNPAAINAMSEVKQHILNNGKFRRLHTKLEC
jgi:hypothetical protein